MKYIQILAVDPSFVMDNNKKNLTTKYGNEIKKPIRLENDRELKYYW